MPKILFLDQIYKNSTEVVKIKNTDGPLVVLSKSMFVKLLLMILFAVKSRVFAHFV